MTKTPIKMEGIGTEFFQQTKYQRGKLGGHSLRWELKPNTYKKYSTSPTFPLISPENFEQNKTLIDILHHRRSERKFSDRSITLPELSYLLWGSTGINQQRGQYELRTAPSAGALYPIETYIAINKSIEDLTSSESITIPKGLYHYNIQNHYLEQLKTGDFAQSIAAAALDQRMAAKSPVVFIWSAVFPRNLWKYRQRGYRYIFLDAGHIAAHLSLVAVDLGLKSCQIAALYDEEFNQLLNLDGFTESVIYLSVVGK